MRVLILGSGGREHALAWRCSQDASVEKVFVWPGNDGMKGEKVQVLNLEWRKETFATFLKTNAIDFVIPGSEKFLYEGVSDWCEELKVLCFGPSQRASQLEESKIFSKELMKKAGVPTAPFMDITESFNRDVNEASGIIKQFKNPVIKISGPALGKGVFVCENPDEACEVLRQLKESPVPGIDQGLLVEEGVSGKEVSVFFACNEMEYSYLGSAQDHKRLLDGDKGPNTGGMGTVSPVSWVNEEFIERVKSEILLPTLTMMKETGIPFRGVLFLGLMVNGKEINLLEYNVRFGDPETQVLMPLIEGDFTQLLSLMTKGEKCTFELKKSFAVHVVKSARGYPGTFGTNIEKGQPISVARNLDANTFLFFAGVKTKGEGLVTSGGRVLGVTARAESFEAARENVYKAMNNVHFEGEHMRLDIGKNL
ncbi:MAG: phosphoribosylamine--glycine ligase [Bacteriovoracia bacterium]